MRLLLARHRDHAPVRVEQHDARVDGVERIDVLQHGERGTRIAAFAAGQRSDQHAVQRPPAAIVGPFVEIAREQLDGEGGHELAVLEHRRYGRFVQLADRALEHVLRLAAHVADLPQQRLGERDVRGGAGGETHAAVPHGAVEIALNRIGLARNLAQAGREDGGIAADVGERLGAALKVARAILGFERPLHRNHHMAAPRRARVTLIRLRAACDREIFATGKAHDATVDTRRRRHARAGRNLIRVRARDHLIAIVDERQHAPIRVVAQPVEDPAAFVFELEAQAQHRDGVAFVGDPMRIDQRPARIRHQVARCERFDVRRAARKRCADERVLRELRGLAARQLRQQFSVRRDQHHVVVDGILGHVLRQPALDRFPGHLKGTNGPFGFFPTFANHGLEGGCVPAKLGDGVVRGQEAHVGRALEQVADEDVDRHLGACFAGEHGFLVGFGAQMGHQVGGKGLEGLPGAAEVGAVIAQMGKQGKVVPCPLEGSETLPVLDHGRHPLQKLLFLGHEHAPRKGYD